MNFLTKSREMITKWYSSLILSFRGIRETSETSVIAPSGAERRIDTGVLGSR